MVAILYPRRLYELRDVTQPGIGLPDQGVPQLQSSNSSFVVQTIAAGGGGSFSLGASNLGNTLGDTGVTGTRVVLAGIGNLTLSQLTDVNGGTISISAGTAAGAGFSAGVSGGNTSGDTGATGTRLVFAGGQSITLSQATDVNGGTVTISGASTSQSAQTQNRFNLTLDGNTAGVLAQISSGTMTLAGGNGITLSQAGNAVTISGNTFSQSVQPETQTFVGGISASNTLYTSGTVNIVGTGNITVASGTGQRVIISGSQSVQPETQTFVGGIAGSDTTYTSGTVRITGVGGGVTVSSNTGQRVDISVAAQSVQTQSAFNLTISGNTSGAGALISSGTMTLAGGNNITVSQAGNAITISGPNVGGAQTGISGLANSETTYTSGSVTFSALGAITIRSTTGQHFQFSVNSQSVQPETQTFIGGIANTETTYTSGTVKLLELGAITIRSTTGNQFQLSVNSQSVQTQSLFSAGVSTGGNTSGDTGVTGTRLVFVGSNNITLSQGTAAAGGTITISGPTTVAQTNQSGGAYAVGNTYSTSSGSFDARTLSIRGDGIISVAASNSGWRISASQSVQAETQTFVGGIAASNTTYTSGTITITGVGGGVTVSSNTGQRVDISVAAPVAQTGTQFSMGLSNLGNTAGDTVTVAGRVVLAGSNGITLSGSSNGVSQTITISGITQSAESQSIGMSNIGNTSGTTGIASGAQVRMLFAGGNNITLSQSLNGASGTITISAPNAVAQTNQSLGMYAVQNTTGQSSSTTMDARTISVAGDGAVSVGYSAGSLRISAPVQTVESQSIGMSNIGNTSGTTGIASGGQVRFLFAGGNNITLSQSLNGASGTITISAPNLGAGAMSVGVSNLGNTAGSTGVTGTRLVLVGTNNITLSQSTDANGGTVSISGGAGGGFSAGVSTGGNTAGATGMTGTQLVLVGTNPISLSQTTGANGATVSIDAPATSSIVGTSGVSISTNGSTISVMATSGGLRASAFEPFQYAAQTSGNQGQASLHMQPIHVCEEVQHDRVGLGVWISNASNSSNSITLSNWIGIFTKNASTLSMVSSTSTSNNFSGSGTVGSYSLYGGRRWVTIPWTNTLSVGDYWVAIVNRSTTGGGAGHTVAQILQTQHSNATFSGWSGILGAATAASGQYLLGMGTYSVSTSGIPSNIALSELTGSGTLVMQPPMFFLRSGTA